MKLYLKDNGGWAGTQADAGKKGTYKQVDVPTDKPGLLAWLNERSDNGDSGQDRESYTYDQDRGYYTVSSPEPKKPTIQEQRERFFERKLQLDEYIQEADYDEARRVQSLAVERLVEHVSDMRSKRDG